MSFRTLCCFLFCCFIFCLPNQLLAQTEYEVIKKKFEDYKENDPAALKYVNEYIKIAKSKKDYPKLAEAYENAQYFSPDPETKRKYADSCKTASLKTYDTALNNQPNNKSNVYYFNLNRYILTGIGAICLLIIVAGILIFVARRYFLKEKRVQTKYSDLEKRLKKESEPIITVTPENLPIQNKVLANTEKFLELEQKLNQFEETKGFTESGITLTSLAEKLSTNTSYLSQYINDSKGVNFNKYLSTLRINYITQQMYNDPQYLKYSIQGLADLCGIASRQNFSDLFTEINGIRPTDFIKQRKKELSGGG